MLLSSLASLLCLDGQAFVLMSSVLCAWRFEGFLPNYVVGMLYKQFQYWDRAALSESSTVFVTGS